MAWADTGCEASQFLFAFSPPGFDHTEVVLTVAQVRASTSICLPRRLSSILSLSWSGFETPRDLSAERFKSAYVVSLP